MLATFAILAMFGFVVSDSLPKLLNNNTGVRDQPIAELYGKTVYRSGLNKCSRSENRANMFLSELNPYLGRTPFGGVKDRDLIDALILQHEADRLGMPAGAEMGKELLKNITQGRMNGETFRGIAQSVQQPRQRRTAPGRYRQPGPPAQSA